MTCVMDFKISEVITIFSPPFLCTSQTSCFSLPLLVSNSPANLDKFFFISALFNKFQCKIEMSTWCPFSREGQECPDLFSRFYWDILSFLPFHSMSLVMVFRHVSAPSPLPAMATCHGPGGRRPALGQFSPLPPSPLCPGPSFSSGPGHTRPSPGPFVLFIKNFACFLRKTSCRMSYLSGAALWYHFVINGPLCPSVGPRTRAGKER